MLTGAEREYLDDDVRAVAFPHEVLDLRPHDLRAAHPPGEHALVEHDADLWWRRVGAHQYFLALQPDLNAPFDLPGRVRRPAAPDDGAGVVRGLQQAGDQLRLVGPDRRRLRLQADQICVQPGHHDATV